MQKKNSKKLSTAFSASCTLLFKIRKSAGLLLGVAALSMLPLLASEAQRIVIPAKVSLVALQPTTAGTTISVVADSDLSHAQTWQDSEGYHLVLPNTIAADSLDSVRGLKLRRLGSSLELLVQTRAGAKVNYQLAGNRLDLFVDGKLAPRPSDVDVSFGNASNEKQFENSPANSNNSQSVTPASTLPEIGLNIDSSGPSSTSPASATITNPNPNANAPQTAPNSSVDQPPSQIITQTDDEGWTASIFSGTSVLIVISLGVFGLLVSRKLRSREAIESLTDDQFEDDAQAISEVDDHTSLVTLDGFQANATTSLARIDSGANGSSRISHSPVVRLPAGPSSLYGAYRIDQEVGKLVFGQAHRIDVLGSRASDDRRAIETSLIKGVNSPDLDEAARRRAREALEEYGFVARQCAALLLAPDAFERTSAARMLGDIKSPAALPFLLESLYDSESIVRNQAVVSIGELKIPSAIGALLDIARTHPDVPSALLSRTLSACSVEGLDFFDAVAEPGLLGSGGNFVEEITRLAPSSPVEDLPESSDDPIVVEALESLESENAERRAEALKVLAEYPVQNVVRAITAVASNDSQPGIRSQAISTLAAINHESVFPAVLVGLNDDTREVRAAAARSLSRLSFDRAEAYARVIESGKDETIQNVAEACVKAGIVSQNLDRLASSDHRQAYETFTLICLLAKAKAAEPVLEAISNHPNMDVRIKVVQLLAATGQPEIFGQLRELAVQDGMREDVKTALLDALYRLEQRNQEVLEVHAELAPEEQLSEADDFEFRPAQIATELIPRLDTEVQHKADELEC